MRLFAPVILCEERWKGGEEKRKKVSEKFLGARKFPRPSYFGVKYIYKYKASSVDVKNKNKKKLEILTGSER